MIVISANEGVNCREPLNYVVMETVDKATAWGGRPEVSHNSL